jgi:glycosyltransferase involved in cell wall biosynthesis
VSRSGENIRSYTGGLDISNNHQDSLMERSPGPRIRIAWFSPVPPVRSGIATNSAELVRRLSARYAIDVFVDAPADGARSAHDFVWLHRQRPYDLTVFQVGNSSHHNFLWPYLFRFPGLAVLHDVHLHHARAALLLTEKRAAQYRAEFAANHPDANPDLAEVAVAGFDSYLYYMWPMTRLIVQASRLAAVHSRAMAERLREALPDAAVEAVRLTQGEPVSPEREARARAEVRARYGLAPEAIVVGVFGGLTPEKRVPQILSAFAATMAAAPAARLLLAGAAAPQYDAAGDVAALGLRDRVAITGYLETDDELTDAIAACDIVVNLRWPTAREMSGPWLRALAAGKATITIDLAHLWDIPSFDPRTWTANLAGVRGPGAVTVAIDILDEDHSLRLALRRLATDADLRASLGAAARQYWRDEHSPEASVEDYDRVIARALARPAPRADLPPHLIDNGDSRLRDLLGPFGVGVHFEDSTQR